MKKKHYFYDDLGRQYYDYYEEEPSLFETLATWIFNLIAASIFAFIFVAILAVSFLYGGAIAWINTYKHTFLCLLDAGIFVTIRLFWKTIPYTYIAYRGIKAAVLYNRFPAEKLVVCNLIVSFLATFNGFEHSMGQRIGETLSATLSISIVPILVMYLIFYFRKRRNE